MHLSLGATLKQYRILGLLGKGGMGEVYAADDTKLGRKVAIKILPAALAGDAERLRRFTQEAKAASALNHPSILTIYDVDEVDGHPFLVTEFIEGQTLRERLRAPAAAVVSESTSRAAAASGGGPPPRQGRFGEPRRSLVEGGAPRALKNESPLSLRDAVEIAGEIASALSAAHTAGIVHRDVKPENIMLRDDGHAKLLDFGLAKIDLQAGSAEETMAAPGRETRPGVVMGTTAYMSPEQARGLNVDARSDIFSLGVVLYEMVAGRPPFQGETPSDVIAAILRVDPPALPDLPPDFELTLRKALEKDRDERHQTAKDLAADLKRLRRRLDPAAGTSAPAGQGAGSWTSTPKSGGAATSASAPRETAASHAQPVSGAAAPTSARGRLVAALAAIVVIGIVGAVLWRAGLAPWLSGAAGTGAGVPNFDAMTVEKVSGLGLVSDPAISHDGKLLAYVRTEASETTIWLRQMATGSVVKVVGPTLNIISGVQFTPDGNFLYYSEHTPTRPIRYMLMSVPAFGGAAREIAEGRFSRVSFSPDGKRFVATRNLPAGEELVVMNADGSGTASVIATSPKGSDTFLSPAWSPSGAELAMINSERGPSGVQMNIQFMKPDGTGVRTLTPAGSPRPFLDEIAWTASAETLVATGGGSSRQILLIRTSDGHVERVTNDVHDYSALSFSPGSGAIATVQTTRLGSIWIGPGERPEDARELPSRLGETDGSAGLSWLNDRELVFTRMTTDLSSLWTMQADGTGARRVAEGSLAATALPRASRDGRTVVFDGIREIGILPEVYRLTLPDGRVTQVTREGGAMKGISSDGRTVFFSRFGAPPPAQLLSMATDGGSATPVFEAPQMLDYAVSRDGTELAVIANNGVGTPRTLSLLPAGGGSARTIFTTGTTLSYVRWYPSGDALLLIMTANNQSNLFRLERAGGTPRQLSRFTRGWVSSAEISPDGRRIAYHRGSAEPNIVLLKPKAE